MEVQIPVEPAEVKQSPLLSQDSSNRCVSAPISGIGVPETIQVSAYLHWKSSPIRYGMHLMHGSRNRCWCAFRGLAARIHRLTPPLHILGSGTRGRIATWRLVSVKECKCQPVFRVMAAVLTCSQDHGTTIL